MISYTQLYLVMEHINIFIHDHKTYKHMADVELSSCYFYVFELSPGYFHNVFELSPGYYLNVFELSPYRYKVSKSSI
jgi:hypothetical protein